MMLIKNEIPPIRVTGAMAELNMEATKLGVRI
jgi:hypothetical protein